MSFVECNPNHCPSIKAMGESLIKQELKIKQLEQEKAELLEYLKYLYTSQLIKSQRMTDILNKYK